MTANGFKPEMPAGRELTLVKQETIDSKCRIQTPGLGSMSILVFISLALNCLVQ